MALPKDKHDALLDYSLQLCHLLSGNGAKVLKTQMANIVARIGQLAEVPHVHLLIVRKKKSANPSVSLLAEWSSTSHSLIGPRLQGVPLPFLGKEAVATLKAGTPFFSTFDEQKNACSKFISGLLRELDLSSYDLIPIVSDGDLTAIVGLAHQQDSEYLDSQSRRTIQLIGSMLVRSILLDRRERIRRRNHRQWKRVANGACDFALRIDSRLEICNVIPFRQEKPPQATGLLITEFVLQSSCESVVEAIQSVKTLLEPRSLQFFAINSSGRPCSYAARIEPPSAKSGKRELTMYLTNNDVERAHAEELSSLRDQLDRATRLSLLGNIATEFAHQLTQPLQAITNHLHTLSMRVSRKQAQRSIIACVNNIETSVDHAAAIIRSLRDFVTNRRMSLTQTSVVKMVSHAVAMVEAQSERNGTKIIVDETSGILSRDSSPDVFVDEVQTTHVIINLLVNAIEACVEADTESPIITVSATVDSARTHVIVEVSDNGPGIIRENPESVFDRFFTTKSEGFGIGLAICRDVIERQDGNIHARNNPDRGCCFYFTLPLFTGQVQDDSRGHSEHDE